MKRQRIGEYVEVERFERKGRKTAIWNVFGNGSESIGQIRWCAPWRSFTFYPMAETLYDAGCLRSIADFLGTLNVKHRDEVAKRREVKPYTPDLGEEHLMTPEWQKDREACENERKNMADAEAERDAAFKRGWEAAKNASLSAVDKAEAACLVEQCWTDDLMWRGVAMDAVRAIEPEVKP